MLAPIGIGAIASSGAAEAGFTGAYDDIPNITAAYGMRRLLTSYEGNLLRIRRSSDDTEQNFGYDANGDLDTAAIATFIAAGSGFVVTWYDQSGNANNLPMATAANQPLYVASGQNDKPTIRFDGDADTLEVAFTLDQPCTFFGVLKQVSWKLNDYLWDGYANVAYLSQRESSPGIRIHAGANLPATADNNLAVGAFGNVIAVYNGASSLLQINDETANEGDAGTSNPGGVTLGGPRPGFAGIDGNVEYAEMIVANAAWDADTRTAARTATNAYWGLL